MTRNASVIAHQKRKESERKKKRRFEKKTTEQRTRQKGGEGRDGEGMRVAEAVKLAALAFVGSSWMLFVSPEHKLPHGWSRMPVAVRFGVLDATQLVAGITAALSLLVLVGFTGVAFLQTEMKGLEQDQVAKEKKVARGPSWTVKAFSLAVTAVGVLYSVVKCSSRLAAQRRLAEWPDHVGLLCGIGSVAVAQVFLMMYHFVRKYNLCGPKDFIQSRGPTSDDKTFFEDTLIHLSNPGAFLLLLPYLSLTWMFRLMPDSYYDFDSPTNWKNVLLQLLVVDFFTFTNHIAEHCLPTLYKASHKPHHRFYSPQFFNAFDGSLLDTVCLILFPLFTTAQLLHVSTRDYIAFGTCYSTHFMLIHSEFSHPFDTLLSFFFVNTAEDHHVHHAAVVANFGHFFTIFDRIAGTYRPGNTVPGFTSFEKILPVPQKSS